MGILRKVKPCRLTKMQIPDICFEGFVSEVQVTPKTISIIGAALVASQRLKILLKTALSENTLIR